jgi:pantetheine-phosphate adenylyltransferase
MKIDSAHPSNVLPVVYAGTFDPVTNGHMDIVRRACRVFDRLIVAVADVGKPSLLFAIEDRVNMLREATKEIGLDVEVCSFSGLLVNFMKGVGAKVVIRGLRAVSDYEYEFQMAITNRELDANMETVFLMTSKDCSFVSSSIVREISRHGGDVSSLVPSIVSERLRSYFGR